MTVFQNVESLYPLTQGLVPEACIFSKSTLVTVTCEQEKMYFGDQISTLYSVGK